MNDKKEIQKCEECDGKIMTDYIRNENYCEVCGLVKDPIHPMGHGINGLVSYASHNGLQNKLTEIRLVTTTQGLRAGRLFVAGLVN